MVKEALDGFCMALADSVPGVSGGTVAFIMGFYDQLIGSINDVIFGDRLKKRKGIGYLIRLGFGWAVGMGIAVLILNALFEKNIHFVSSLFIGFIIGALPVICVEEAEAIREWKKGLVFLAGGAALVAGVTFVNTLSPSAAMELSHISAALALKLFLIGMVAISAMFLPGISGSTMLLIFGAYMPVMKALKELMHLHLTYLPAILVFMLGLLAGTAGVSRLIQAGLASFRPQMIYFILGMMAASLYAVVMGPTTLDVPQAPLNAGNFSMTACVIGVGLIAAMQVVKNRRTAEAAA